MSVGDAFYSIPWHDIDNLGVRKSLVLMIASAQKPVLINAMGLFQINNDYTITVSTNNLIVKGLSWWILTI